MASKQGAGFVTGSVEVAESGKPIALTSTPLEKSCIGVWLGADSGNAGKRVVFGDKNIKFKAKEQRGVAINEFTIVFIEIDDPSKIFVDVETSKDKAVWTAILA